MQPVLVDVIVDKAVCYVKILILAVNLWSSPCHSDPHWLPCGLLSYKLQDFSREPRADPLWSIVCASIALVIASALLMT